MNGEQLEIDIINTSMLVQRLEAENTSSCHIEASGWGGINDNNLGYPREKTPSQSQIIGPSFDAISWIDIDGFFGTYYNKQFFNEIWSKQLRKFLESVKNGRRLEDIEIEFVIKALYEDYITSLLQSINCGELLTPERKVHSYLFSDILPCRDQIIHSEVLRLMGINMLSAKTADGNQTVLEILKKAMKKTDFWKSSQEITKKSHAKAPRSLEESIMNAWDIVTLFHEVGRLEKSYKNTLSYIYDYIFCGDRNTTGSVSGDFYRDVALAREPEWQDHGEKNSVLIDILVKAVSMVNKKEVEKDKRCIVPYYLAKNSLAAETRYLRSITTKDYDAERKVIELWQDDPLGCLFVTVLILSGMTTRICWNSKGGKKIENGEEFTIDDIGIYMPVKGLKLERYPSRKTRLIYEVVEKYAPLAKKEWEGLLPIDETRVNFLRVALGPKCLQLLSEEELEAEWNWINVDDSNEEEKMISNTEIFNVFICHCSKDKKVVEDIIKEFKRKGISYWVDHEQIEFGDEITGKIEDGLKKSKYTVVILSKNLGKSNWCRKEYGPIINRECNKPSGKKVIPLKIDDCSDDDIPMLLYDKRRADYLNKEDFEELLSFLKE